MTSSGVNIETKTAHSLNNVTFVFSGLVTPSGLSSVGGGLETPGEIELRKKKEIEDAMETGGETPALFHVLNEKRTNVGASMMGSAHTYDLGLQTPKKVILVMLYCSGFCTQDNDIRLI